MLLDTDFIGRRHVVHLAPLVLVILLPRCYRNWTNQAILGRLSPTTIPRVLAWLDRLGSAQVGLDWNS